jgi:hypothetical protein
VADEALSYSAAALPRRGLVARFLDRCRRVFGRRVVEDAVPR